MASEEKRVKRVKAAGGPTGAVYGFGLIGALIYYVHFHSGTLWLIILAVLKALVWPALLVYHLLLFLHM